MTNDIVIDDDFVSVEGVLRVDQIRPLQSTSLRLMARCLKVLKPGTSVSTLREALSHDDGDKLVINKGGNYKGGVAIHGLLKTALVTIDDSLQVANEIVANNVSAKKITAKDVLLVNGSAQVAAELQARSVVTDNLSINKSFQIKGSAQINAHSIV